MEQSINEILGSHQLIYDFYFSQADPSDTGYISSIDALAFLKQSKLSDSTLKQIWDLADQTGKGYLDRQSFYITLKLISLSQSNIEPKLDKLKLNTPAPKLGELSSNMFSLIANDDTWYIKASSRIAFDKTFETLSPIDNKISGTRVKPFLLNSGLPVDILGKIWDLSDVDSDGQLSRSEFLIAMQLVTKAKEGVIIPEQLPSSLLPSKTRHSIGLNSNVESKSWVVSFDEKTKSDLLFNTLDTDKDGFVTGLEVKDVFMKTGLPQSVLANIWTLCDGNSVGKLNNEQFALAMHFVNKKCATGLDPPAELTPEMIPPSLRPKQHTDDSFLSKDLEELQTQVNELQREKLYYEHRASEHDAVTRQKRTELSNLELEHDSLFKTLRERELNRSEEQKKLNEYEEKLHKSNSQLVELKKKYETEKREIENFKFQISNMESSVADKDNNLSKIKNDLSLMKTERSSLEARVQQRRNTFNELNSMFLAFENENKKDHEKCEYKKQMEQNLNKLLKEYGYALTNSANNSEEIRRLEENEIKIKEKFKNENYQALSQKLTQNSSLFPLTTTPTNFNAFNDNNNFDEVVSHSSLSNTTDINDPFNSSNAFNDPFKDSDPFRANLNMKTAFDNNFSNTFDPFMSNPADDNRKKNPPPRPAPPRPHTPQTHKPVKKPSDRPQSAMDFTNNKLDLFTTDFDPFNDGGKKSNWAAFE